MSGTVAAAVKAALAGSGNVLSGLPGLDGVKVAYDMPRDVPREVIFGGSVSGPVQLVGMRGGTRVKRREDLNLQLHIRVYLPGQPDCEASDARAAELSEVVEDYIAANHTLGDLPGLKKVAVENVDLDGFIEDDGATSTLTLTLGIMSFLD